MGKGCNIMNQNLPPYSFRRSIRSRHVRVTVSAGGQILVTAPVRVSNASVAVFLTSKTAWLWEKFEYFKKIPEPKISPRQEKKLYVLYKERALVLARMKVAEWNRHYGFSFGKISIRNSRSRWGSCSSKGTLCFNYKIVFLPEHLSDYLVVHELCHLKERNHGKGFWTLVALTVPDFANCRKELRRFEINML